jgi:hypothetical protein
VPPPSGPLHWNLPSAKNIFPLCSLPPFFSHLLKCHFLQGSVLITLFKILIL